MNKDEIRSLLEELGSLYDTFHGPPLRIGICGGAALLLTGLIDRTTVDVDVLYPPELPPDLAQSIQIVAKNHGLSDRWMNVGPKDLFTMGLPSGFDERAEKWPLGKNLTAYLASRQDQIFFKLYAAADRAGYHVTDLLALKPSEEEIRQAALWCFTHDISPEFRALMRSMLRQIGYERVAEQI